DGCIDLLFGIDETRKSLGIGLGHGDGGAQAVGRHRAPVVKRGGGGVPAVVAKKGVTFTKKAAPKALPAPARSTGSGVKLDMGGGATDDEFETF
ncbi:MAG: hypothetical protein HQL86_03830, partial [Magnetococcales bacterium]|nr:hypothetical protein [Magnetococcales bacterium]